LQQEAVCGPKRGLRNRFVIALDVCVGDTCCLVVGTYKSRHRSRRIQILAAGNQPKRYAEVRRVRPPSLGQRQLKDAATDLGNLRVAGEGNERASGHVTIDVSSASNEFQIARLVRSTPGV
jgi:hypothetical protein